MTYNKSMYFVENFLICFGLSPLQINACQLRAVYVPRANVEQCSQLMPTSLQPARNLRAFCAQ